MNSQKFYTSYSKLSEIKLITIGLASSELIKYWAERTLPNGKILGEVMNANTLHHKTFKPQKGGLFCERIFGPLKDFQCACGKPLKYRKELIGGISNKLILGNSKSSEGSNINTKSIFGSLSPKIRNFCPSCEVEYTWSITRRYQLGYINLVSPVTHVWYLKGNPSYLSILLDIKKRHLELVTYCSETLTLENSLKGTISNLKSSDIVASWKRLKKQMLEKNEVNNSHLLSFKNKKNSKINLLKLRVEKRKKLKENSSYSLNNKSPFDFVNRKQKDTHPKLDQIKYLKFCYKNQIYSQVALRLFDHYEFNKLNFNFQKNPKKGISSIIENNELNNNAKILSLVKIIKQEKTQTNAPNTVDDFKDYFKRLDFSKIKGLAFFISQFKTKYHHDYNNFFNKFVHPRQILTKISIPAYILLSLNFFSQKPILQNSINRIWNLLVKTAYKKSLIRIKNIYEKLDSLLLNKTMSLKFSNPTLSGQSFRTSNTLDPFNSTDLSKLAFLSSFLSPSQIKEEKRETFSKNLNKTSSFENGTLLNLKKKIKLIKNLLFTFLIDKFNGSQTKRDISKREAINKTPDFYLEFYTLSNLPNSIINSFISKITLSLILKNLSKNSHFNKITLVSFLEKMDPKGSSPEFNPVALGSVGAQIKGQDNEIGEFLKPKKLNKPNLILNSFFSQLISNLSNLFVKNFLSNQGLKNNLLGKYNEMNFLENSTLNFKDNLSLLNSIKKYFTKIYRFKTIKPSNNLLKNTNETNSRFTAKSFKEEPLGAFLYTSKFGAIKNLDNPISNSKIYNNIYCLSHRERWDNENDWNILYYYLNGSSENKEEIIPNYKSRYPNNLNKNGFSPFVSLENKASFLSPSEIRKPEPYMPSMAENSGQISKSKEFNKKVPFFSGSGMIELLLTEYNFIEIKKIDKQNRILLYQLNKQIIKLKKNYNNSSKKALKESYKKRDLLVRRTKLVRKIFIKESSPESLILNVLPVLPPDLRPIVKMGNQIAASDLNRLYQRVIYRNDRLKKFLKDSATSYSFEMKYAQRLLQEAVDNLIQNGKSGMGSEKDSRGRLLKSLSEILKGKQGRFRQYLLGKRVDYSGRSVIVVGPKLKLHECGLPKEIALELYLPFLLKQILNLNLARTVVGAKLLIKTHPSLVWQLLKEIMQTCPVLLNRAPTLHRLGIQSFQPKLIDGRAILLHPLVCSAFNADFDGDQMAVHVPITVEARAEAWKLMLSRNNILAPSTGDPLAIPSQDMVLGCYYLTTNLLNSRINYSFKKRSSGFYFSKINQVLKAYQLNKIDLHSNIWLKWNGGVENGLDQEQPIEIRVDSYGKWKEILNKSQKNYNRNSILQNNYILTTVGRILFNLKIQNSLL